MAWTFTKGGTTYRGIGAYVAFIFSQYGLILLIYFLIGIFYNTAPPFSVDCCQFHIAS